LSSYLHWLSPQVDVRGSALDAPFPNEGPRLFYCYRNQDVVALALVLCRESSASSIRSVRVVVDDSLGGRLSAGLGSEMGHDVLWLRRSPFGQRARDVQTLIRTQRSIGIAVDTGGPYGEVRSSLPRLAARCGARLVPVAAMASPSLPIWPRPWIGVPLPGAVLSFAVGEAVEGGDSPEVLRRLQASLDRAVEHARSQLRSEDMDPAR
jgi:hypothetical protein